MCICSLRYPAYTALASYFHLWPAWLYKIFPHYLINSTIFEKKKVTEHKMCVLIPLQLLSETFLILGRTERDIIKNIYSCSCKVPPYSCQILMKLEFSRRIFEEHSNIKFHENPSSGSRVLPSGQTEGRMERRDRRSLGTREPSVVWKVHRFSQTSQLVLQCAQCTCAQRCS